jgi:hypothetical protein
VFYRVLIASNLANRNFVTNSGTLFSVQLGMRGKSRETSSSSFP